MISRLRRLLPLALPLFLACSASRAPTSFGAGGNGGDSTSSTSGGGGATGSSSSSGGIDLDGGPSDGPAPPEKAEVFAESSSTLYRLNPDTKEVVVVGDFQGCSSVIDIAVDKDGKMFGTTFNALYAIDKATAVCTHIADGNYPNSLSLVPKGTVDPNEEALVGYVGSDYVRIDKVTGTVTTIGSLGSAGLQSSGDVVSVIGGGTYLTVKGGNCADCIVEIDPKSGALTKMIGPLGHGNVFGLAFWGGVAYGFDDAGELIQIDLSNGTSQLIAIPGAPANLSFYGAGSTTAAPVVPK